MRTDPFFAWLGVIFALVVVGQLLVSATSAASATLNTVTTVLWAVFLAEFLAKLLVAPHRRRFLRRHIVQVVMLLAPMLRVLSLVRLARLGRLLPVARVASASYRSVGTARQLVRTRVAYLAGVSSVAVVAIGELGYIVDGGRHGELPTLADALLWSAGTVIGMSPTLTPHSRLAQLVMVVGFVVGVVVITALAGTLGSFLLDSRAERATAEDPPTEPHSAANRPVARPGTGQEESCHDIRVGGPDGRPSDGFTSQAYPPANPAHGPRDGNTRAH